MILLPAIDLYEGKSVRLYQGDYRKMTVYSEHPVELARKIEAAGASALHVVDLEGAKSGTTPNLSVIEEIAEETNLRVECGGGIRSMETIADYINAGVSRVILGSRAIEDEDFLKEAFAQYGERIAVGVDAKDEKIAVHGWTKILDLNVFDYLEHAAALGIQNVICTDIARDGAMQGTNIPFYQNIIARIPALHVIASGGVSSLDDLRALKEAGCHGAILGKAMYTGAVDLKAALKEVQS